MFIIDASCHSLSPSIETAPSQKPEDLTEDEKLKKKKTEEAAKAAKAVTKDDFTECKILHGSPGHKSLVEQAAIKLHGLGLLPRAHDVWQEESGSSFLFFFKRQQELLNLLREAMAIRWKMEKENREIERVFNALVFSASNPIGAIKSLKNLLGSLTSAAALSLAGSSISGLASFAAMLAIKRAREDPNFARELFAVLNSPVGHLSGGHENQIDVIPHFHSGIDKPDIEQHTEALPNDLQGAQVKAKDGEIVVEKNDCQIACIEKENFHGHGEKIQTTDGKFLGFLHRFNSQQTPDENVESPNKVEKTYTINKDGYFENHVIVVSGSEQEAVHYAAHDAVRNATDTGLAKSAENDARRIHQERQKEINEAKLAEEELKKIGKYSPDAYELNKKIAKA